MSKCLLISSDCHAGLPWAQYRAYLEPRYRETYDRWLPQFQEVVSGGANVNDEKGMNPGARVDVIGAGRRRALAASEAVKEGGLTGAWDPDVRVRELDREGVAGEVIFPDAPNRNHPPFGVGFARPRMEVSVELQQAGARAHNRWLAELCATHPGRHAGLALIVPEDVEAAVLEVREARRAGLFGGIMLPGLALSADTPEAFWNHPRYEPLWAACEDLRMPVHTHASGPLPNYGDSPGSRWVGAMESYLMAYRPFWMLLWSGVLERHPGLKFVITEAGGAYVTGMLQQCDYQAEHRNPEAVRQNIKLRPSEYWARQCFLGASPPAGRAEVEARHAIGVRNILWGSDYPHAEGSWPWSRERTREMLVGVPEAEARLMLGENAAKVYGFDLASLRPVVERIGPEAEELGLAAA